MTNHETAKHLRDAQRRLRSVLVANADRLSTPFTDDPSKNPWDTYLRPAVRGLQEAVNAACEALATPAAVPVPPPAPRADDQAATFREAADVIDRLRATLAPSTAHRYESGLGLAATELRRRADRCPHGCDTSTCPCLACEADEVEQPVGSCVAGEQQNETPEAEQPARPECAHCWRLVENRGTPSMDGNHSVHWVHVPGGFTVCFPHRGADSPRAEPAAGEPVRGQSAPKPSGYLGPRARQVLNGMARGLTNQAIGVELGISPDSVKWHGRRIFAVLGVSTRIDAVAAGRRAGLVSVRCPMCGDGASAGRSGAPVGELPPEGPTGAPEATGGPR